MSNHDVLLHLSLIPGFGPSAFVRLIAAQMQVSQAAIDAAVCAQYLGQLKLSALYNWADQDFIACGLSPQLASALTAGLADQKTYDQERELMQRHGVTLLTLADPDYPALLANIYAPPLVLYVKGAALQATARRIAFVGSRLAGAYAQQVTDLFVTHLAVHGVQIVSGGALGADIMAHKAALRSGIPTIAVFGSGFLEPYPHESIALSEKIIQAGGAIVSPFHMRAQPTKRNFPARNRIITGLSEATVVVQAAEKSGALISARYALEQGRTVCAVPGRIDDPLSAGTHLLLTQGATLLHSVADLDLALGLVPHTELDQPTEKQMHISADHGDHVDLNTVAVTAAQQEEVHPLLHAWQTGTACSIDQLLEKTGMPLAELQDQLFMLQLDGKVVQNFMGGWQRVAS